MPNSCFQTGDLDRSGVGHKAQQQGPADRSARLSGLLLPIFRLRIDRSASRVAALNIAFACLFLLIAARLVAFGSASHGTAATPHVDLAPKTLARPDIIDRNGEILATDIRTVSVFAEPGNIYDKDEAVELLTAVLPELNATELRAKLSSRKGRSGAGFVWVKRELTPKQQAEVHRLGIPGIGFLPDHKRVYPNGVAAAHILGATNLDGVGIAGMEKYIDTQGISDLNAFGMGREPGDLKPVQLSIDLRVQHAMRDELAQGMAHFRAKSAASMLIDVTTGEVISLASLPDFDPNDPADALQPDRINRMAVGVYEMGSTFKALTNAMALDSGKVSINSTFDARENLHFGRFTIHDFHGTHRVLTLPEVFIHSSNIGTGRMALAMGVEAHKAFLKKLGQLDRMWTELPESAMPIVPSHWGELNTVTISYGHGIAVTPLQAVAAVGALINGGTLLRPTFLMRSPEEAQKAGVRVIKPETSEAIRYIMRLNATVGSAKKAEIPGYFVGGKTGTAEKVVHGRYDHNRLFTTFMAALPMNHPRYLFVTIYDEPQPAPETHGYATAAYNAGDTTGRMVERIAPLLGLPMQFEPPRAPFPLMARLHAWGIEKTP